MRALLFASIALAVGCGGSSTQAKAKPKPAQDPLSAELARRASAPRGAQAVVTFAVFHPGQPATPNAMITAVRSFYRNPPAGMKPVVERIGVRPELSLVALPIEDLPLDIDALKATAGDAKIAADQAQSVRFVRYVGPPGGDGQHLLAAALATVAVSDGAPIVDLATRTWWGADTFAAAVADEKFMGAQVVPVGEPTGEKTVRFFTLGMAKLGLPDVEMDGVEKHQARALFEGFQRFTFAMRENGYAEPGDTVAGLKLLPCVRPKDQYDHKCVRIPVPAVK